VIGKTEVKPEPKIGTILISPITLLNAVLCTFIILRKLKQSGAETLAKFIEEKSNEGASV